MDQLKILKLMVKEQSVIKSQKGFVVVEALLAACTLLLFFTVFVGVMVYNQKSYENLSNRQRAIFLAEEGIEGARSIRDNNFDTIIDGNYGLGVTSNIWAFSGTSDTNGLFNRQINISTVATDKKQISSTVSWTSSNNVPESVSLITYLTNWAKIVTSSACWDNPAIESGLSVGSCATGREVVVQGNYAYMTKSGTSYFSIIDITDTTDPTLVGSCARTNCSLSGTLNSVAVQGNYAYIASSNNSGELYVINISNKAQPTLAYTYNASGNGDGQTLWISDNRLYMTRSSGDWELGIFNLSNPAQPALLGSLNLESTCIGLDIVGNYAYLACSDNSREFQVVDVSNPSTLSLTKRYVLNLSNSDDGYSIDIIGSTAYLGRSNGYIYSINITNPLVPTLISSYNFGGTVYRIAHPDDTTLVAVGNSYFEEVQFVNVSDPSSMSNLSSLDVPGFASYSGQGVFYSSDLSRIITAGGCDILNSNQQFLILNGTCE
jgi:hypothetical protein